MQTDALEPLLPRQDPRLHRGPSVSRVADLPGRRGCPLCCPLSATATPRRVARMPMDVGEAPAVVEEASEGADGEPLILAHRAATE